MKTISLAAALVFFAAFEFVSGHPNPSESPEKPVAKLEDQISKDGSTVKVELFNAESPSNWHYEIKVSIAGKLAQSIAIRNGQEIGEADIKLVDVNSDGFLDLMIAAGKDHRDKPWFKTFLFSPKTNEYRWINAVENVNEANN